MMGVPHAERADYASYRFYRSGKVFGLAGSQIVIPSAAGLRYSI
jgi:hypothetical protein